MNEETFFEIVRKTLLYFRGIKKIVIFLDFHSTKQGLILGHMALAIPRTGYIPQHVIKAWWKVASQKAGKTLPVFFFVNEHNNTTQSLKLKSNDL